MMTLFILFSEFVHQKPLMKTIHSAIEALENIAEKSGPSIRYYRSQIYFYFKAPLRPCLKQGLAQVVIKLISILRPL